jgi:hypothetical protein
MRRLRMVGLCLAAAVALSSVAAGSAFANANIWEKFNECPLHATPAPGFEMGCIHGEAGPESFFQAGKVTVHFAKTVQLNIGFSETAETETTGQLSVYAAQDGHTITKEAEPAPSLTEGVDASKLSEAEKKRYEEYLASGKSTKVTATIELALPAKDMYLSDSHLLAEEGEAFGFPVMIHLTNAFLGTKCYVGSTAEPIVVPFTVGTTSPPPPNTPIRGTIGELTFHEEFSIVVLKGTKLVDNEYAAPGVNGCGVSGSLDEAVDSALGLPSPAGSNTTILVGKLYQAAAEKVEQHIHN